MTNEHNTENSSLQQGNSMEHKEVTSQEPPEGYVNKACIACGNWIRIIYHQRRAADEPPDAVEYCERCPLNTNTLSIKNNYISDYVSTTTRPMSISSNDSMMSNKQPNLSLSRRYSGINSNNPRSLYLKSTSYIIVVEGVAAKNCYSNAISESRLFEHVTAVQMVLETSTNKQKVNLYTNFSMADEAHCISEEKKIAPMVTLAKVDTYAPRGPINPNLKQVIINDACLLDRMDHVELAILEVTGGKYCKVKLFLSDTIKDIETDEDKILDILHKILITYGHENTIKSFIPTTLVNACYVNSGHAYDYPTAPEVGYVYTWKPDGERFWLVKYGCVWFYVRRLLSGTILGWHKPASMKMNDNVGPIIDVEVMVKHNPILIDVLVMDNGEPTSNVRSITDTLQNFKKLSISDINITVREYFATHKELLRTKNSLTYPVDGTIGIKDHSMTIIKLKSEKSIELKLLEDGSLVAQQGELVAKMALPLVYPVDSIVELRFTKDSTDNKYTITEVIPRTDKQTANEYKVCKSIINTMESMPDNLARRNAVLWCNSIRRKMNETAAGSTGRGRVILDIGAGDGQSVSDYSTSPEVTYILLEPSAVKCKALSRRLTDNDKNAKQRMFKSADQILLATKTASTGSAKYVIVCATLEQILNVDGCLKALTGCVRHCISCFSMSYVSAPLRLLSVKGLNVIGCGYLYDGIEIGNYLVNDHGVTMKRTGERTGAVTWGSDKVYEEPAITSKDFDIFTVKLASEVVPVMKGNDDTLLNTISQRVFIISNGRNI